MAWGERIVSLHQYRTKSFMRLEVGGDQIWRRQLIIS